MEKEKYFWEVQPHIQTLGQAIAMIAEDHQISEDVLFQHYNNFTSQYQEPVAQFEKKMDAILRDDRVAFTGDYAFQLVPPSLFVIDERVRELCCFPYKHSDGTMKECGGITEKRTGCPPYSFQAEETKDIFDKSHAVVLIKYKGLKVYDDQKTLQKKLFQIEQLLRAEGYHIVEGFSARPCRYCEECLYRGDCRFRNTKNEPEHALESCGIHVFETCKRVTRITKNDYWKLELIQNWGLENQSSPTFPSVVAILVTF